MKNMYDYENDATDYTTAQNCREDIIGELMAITQYEKHYYATSDPSARATILDIMNEEKMHVGQLFGLLFTLDSEALSQFEKGYNEFISDHQQ